MGLFSKEKTERIKVSENTEIIEEKKLEVANAANDMNEINKIKPFNSWEELRQMQIDRAKIVDDLFIQAHPELKTLRQLSESPINLRLPANLEFFSGTIENLNIGAAKLCKKDGKTWIPDAEAIEAWAEIHARAYITGEDKKEEYELMLLLCKVLNKKNIHTEQPFMLRDLAGWYLKRPAPNQANEFRPEPWQPRIEALFVDIDETLKRKIENQVDEGRVPTYLELMRKQGGIYSAEVIEGADKKKIVWK